MFRDNAGWLLAGLVSAAVVLGATACGDASCGEIDSIETKEAIVYFPADSTSTVMMVDYPVGSSDAGDNILHVIRHGESEIGVGVHSGKIEKWDVAPQDEGCFRRISRELPEGGD